MGPAYDIAIIGVPFDTAVSYRPGARFGPRAIRSASARQMPLRGFNPRRGLNPYKSAFTLIDCGDMPITPFDNALALEQMTAAFLELGSRPVALKNPSKSNRFPKLLTLGGDHSIALPALRALNQIHNTPLTIVHFDAHLDTWDPRTSYHPSSSPNQQQQHHHEHHHEQSDFTHGSMFWLASREGLLSNTTSVHAGLRTRLLGPEDWADDTRQGFLRIPADAIDDIGVRGVIDLILARVNNATDPTHKAPPPVYLSIDIDVLDPGLCPGTGTPEAGGWTSRELIRILRGLESLNVVGADIVEVAPAYDGVGEQTALVAAQVAYEVVTSWVGRGGGEMEDEGVGKVGEGKEEGGRDEL